MALTKAELDPVTILHPPMEVMIVRWMAQMTPKPKDAMKLPAQVSQTPKNAKLREMLLF